MSVIRSQCASEEEYIETLRNDFAAKAMQGLLACSIQPQSGVDMYAKDAYLIADAMLSARVK